MGILLAVDPGSSRVGVSIFHDGALIHCARLETSSDAKTFTGKLNETLEKLHNIFDALIHEFRVNQICWEIIPAIGNMGHKDFIVSTGAMLKCMAFRYSLEWQGIAAVAAKKAIVGNPKATKIEVRTKVLDMYPELRQRFGVKLGAYDAYDSVIIGLSCIKKNDWSTPLPTLYNWRSW